MDLIEFLRAWLDENEAAAREANTDEARTPYGDRNLAPLPPERWGDLVENYLGGPIGRHCAAWSPGRVLAEVEAKRRLIRPHGPGRMGEDTDGNPARMCRGHNAPTLYPCTTLLVLAQPAADHANFDPAWLTARA